jgi:hypothetical protein
LIIAFLILIIAFLLLITVFLLLVTAFLILIIKFGALLRKTAYHDLTILRFLTFLERMSLRTVDIEVL